VCLQNIVKKKQDMNEIGVMHFFRCNLLG